MPGRSVHAQGCGGCRPHEAGADWSIVLSSIGMIATVVVGVHPRQLARQLRHLLAARREIPLLVKRSLHGGGVALGLVLAAGGAGGAIASIMAGHRRSPRNRLAHTWIGWGLSGVGVLDLGVVPDLWLAGGVAFLTYGLDACGSVMFNPLLKEGVPEALLGRVSAVDYLFSFALGPLGLIVGGAITALTTCIPFLPGVEDPTVNAPGRSAASSV